MEVNLNPQNKYEMGNTMKTLEKVIRLPQQLAEDILKLQKKLLRVVIADKLKSQKIDTYA